jgi:hypothetical protein
MNMNLQNAFNFFETCEFSYKDMEFGSNSSQEKNCLET